MANFTVKVIARAKKHLSALDDKTFAAVEEVLLEMEIDPYAGDYQKLKGGKGHRRRVGRYRIVFDIDTGVRLVPFQAVDTAKRQTKREPTMPVHPSPQTG